jgi:methylmalonyl-CoA/ethylmalonyl-CoA epimerase
MQDSKKSEGGGKKLIDVDRLHVCIAVRDLDETGKWYREMLGFEMFQRQDLPEFSARVAYLKSNGIEIELVESANMVGLTRPDPPNHAQQQGITQLSFRVEDLQEVLRRMHSRSVPVAFGPVDAADLRMKACFIKDNEGNLIEFIERY